MKRALILLLLSVLSAPLFAVRIPYRASIQGGGGSGKCTIEVEVDGVATIEISGAQGVLNSPRGEGANWRRFECNHVLPRNPANFRFSGVDGRGRQELLRPPDGNGGTAVIRITDTGGGREGYTFDIEWNGGDGHGGDWDGGGRPVGGWEGAGGGWGGGANFPASRAIQICQDGVRSEASERYGVKNANFEDVRPDDGPGHNDWIVGRFSSGRGDRYQFSCSVNFKNGSVRNIDIQRGGW